MIIRFFEKIGRFVIGHLETLGQFTILIGNTIAQLRYPPRMRHVFQQMSHLGVDTLPIITLTMLFTGMVITLQTATEFIRLGAQSTVGGIVTIAVGRELGPVLAGVVTAGRVGAAITAEISTMKVTEQIDALKVMATNPIGYLVVPRLIACMFMLPILVVFGDVIGSIGGWMVAEYYDINIYMYLHSIDTFVDVHDITGGLLKSIVFGAIIAIVGCYYGLNAQNGAEGIVKATTSSVVISNIEVNKGETLVIIGGSGSGKSTLLKLLIGLLRPEQGQIFIDGKEISKLKEEELDKVRLNMGMVFQYSALFDSMSVGDNVGFGLQEHSKLSAKEIKEIVEEKLNLVGLSGFANYMPNELSGGMKKRVSLARAIAFEPKILLYDEPSSGLDPVTSAKIDELIVQMQKLLGVTSIVVTHDMKSAFYIADRIAMLYQGEMIAIGTPDEIRNSTDSRVLEFINVSQIRKR